MCICIWFWSVFSKHYIFIPLSKVPSYWLADQGSISGRSRDFHFNLCFHLALSVYCSLDIETISVGMRQVPHLDQVFKINGALHLLHHTSTWHTWLEYYTFFLIYSAFKVQLKGVDLWDCTKLWAGWVWCCDIHYEHQRRVHVAVPAGSTLYLSFSWVHIFCKKVCAD